MCAGSDPESAFPVWESDSSLQHHTEVDFYICISIDGFPRDVAPFLGPPSDKFGPEPWHLNACRLAFVRRPGAGSSGLETQLSSCDLVFAGFSSTRGHVTDGFTIFRSNLQVETGYTPRASRGIIDNQTKTGTVSRYILWETVHEMLPCSDPRVI